MAKKTATINEMRALDEKKLVEQLVSAKLHLQSLVSQQAVGKLKSVSDINKQRRSIAHILTALSEKTMLKEVNDAAN